MHVGIDLGTTYSAVAIFDKTAGAPVVLKNSYRKETTPSVVYIGDDNSVQIGADAKDEFAFGEFQSFAFYKTEMGNPDFCVYANDKEYDATMLSGEFLKKLIEDISKANNIKIDSAVITVPAYFDDLRRNNTIKAGKMAGLDVLRIINEPTSAIIAYGLTNDNREKKVMVYDLGGGTFDVTIASVKGNDVTVIGTSGDHNLGGKNWDMEISEYFFNCFMQEYGYDPRDNDDKIEKTVLASSEGVKQRLTQATSAKFNVNCGSDRGSYEVTREKFEELTRPLIDTTGSLIEALLNSKNLSWKDMDEIVLVGGSTRMPMVSDFIESKCGKRPLFSANVDTIVACGAAIQAELEVNARNGGQDGIVMRKRDTQTQEEYLIKVTNTNIKDVTSHTMGMIALDDSIQDFINSFIINANDPVNEPQTKTYKSNGEEIEVIVLQGEDRNPVRNSVIGRYVVTGVRIGQIVDIKFMYNSNGLVDVTAFDNATGKSLDIKMFPVTESIEEILTRLRQEREKKVKVASVAEIKFMVDTSGSMWGTPLNQAKRAVEDFVSELDLNNTYVSIIDFADSCKIACDFTNDKKKIQQGVDRLGNLGAGGGTSAHPFRDHGKDYKDKNAVKIIVVLTDGCWSARDSEKNRAKEVKNDDYVVYAIGFGSADSSFLNEIASEKGAKKIDLSKLRETFKEIGSSIASEMQAGGGNLLGKRK